MALGWNSVASLVIYPILIPFYVVGFIKWYELRGDWVFRLRYPIEAIVIVIFAMITNNIAVIRSVLDDLEYLNDNQVNIISAVLYSFYWIIFCTVYYRTNLVFLSFKQNQARLYEMGIAADSSHKILFSPRKHCSSYLLLIIIICGAFINFILLVASFPATILWLSMYLVGIIIFLVVKINKAKDLFGCLYECYVLFAVIISHWLVLVFSSGHKDILRFSGFIYNHFISLFMLYYTLYFLYKHPHKPTIKRSESFGSIGSMTSIQSVLSSSHSSQTDEQIQVENKTKTKSTGTKFKLCEYLNNKEKYEIFSKYLAYCWCLEILMFVEKICILYWLVLTKFKPKPVDINEINQLYMMKFEFLTDIYNEYEEIINNDNDDNNDNSFENKRDVLWLVCHKIYKQYIDDDSMNQINISSETRNKIDYLLKTKENISKFISFDDFLNVFNGAICESMSLLCSVYSFRFNSYLLQQK